MDRKEEGEGEGEDANRQGEMKMKVRGERGKEGGRERGRAKDGRGEEAEMTWEQKKEER